MGKLTFLAIVIIVVGIFGGVIEVKFHPEKISSLPATLARVAADGSLVEKSRILATRVKREGEFWLIRDDKQRLEITTTYVESDAKHLNELLAEEQPVEKIVPTAELLTASLERAANVAANASADDLAAWQADAKGAFGEAAASVQRLRETHEEYRELEQKFAAIVNRLEEHVGSLAQEKDGDVAGVRDTATPTPGPTIPAIQLNF